MRVSFSDPTTLEAEKRIPLGMEGFVGDGKEKLRESLTIRAQKVSSFVGQLAGDVDGLQAKIHWAPCGRHFNVIASQSASKFALIFAFSC